MEVIAVATTVCALCQSIQLWIDQLKQREALIDQISSSVLQIHNILQPFASTTYTGTGEYQLSQSIRCVGDVLQRTKEHLVVWKYKRTSKIVAFINPGAQVAKLKDDQTEINNQLIILLTSIATVGYFRDREKKITNDSPTAVVMAPEVVSADTESTTSGSTLVPVDGTGDAIQFWKDFVGVKVNFVTIDLFSQRLNDWYHDTCGDFLTDRTCDRIIMRLDEFNCGEITPHNVKRALGSGTLKEFVDAYVKGDKLLLMPKADITTAPGQQLRTPLLVWIDDHPNNNAYEVEQARMDGVMVIELASTAIAKAWVEANSDFLRQNDDPSRVRFISDNVRFEGSTEGGKFLNHSAGQNFLHYLRGRNLDMPVLIYTGQSINSTQYVTRYSAAGSTTSAGTCLRYITCLATRKSDDTEWQGFKKGY